MLKNYTTTGVSQHRRSNGGIRNSTFVNSHDRLLSNRVANTFQSSRQYKDLAKNLKKQRPPLNPAKRQAMQQQRLAYLGSASIIDRLGIANAQKLLGK
jgi:hypothetical protein